MQDLINTEQKETIVSDNNVIAINPSAQSAVDHIRAEIKKSKGVAEGTIVRFDKVKRRRVRTGRPGGPIEADFDELVTTYAALYVGGKWYLTGHESQTALGSPYANRTFFDDVLGHPEIRNVQVATAFESIEPDGE